MSDAVISVERISKAYRLGMIGGATLKDALEQLSPVARRGRMELSLAHE